MRTALDRISFWLAVLCIGFYIAAAFNNHAINMAAALHGIVLMAAICLWREIRDKARFLIADAWGALRARIGR